jgi:predicted AlkP superfamily phosphohydrolase/phosphomutase
MNDLLSTTTKRVLVIGLDGATWDIMQPWIDAGKLPNLAKLQQNGASGDLLSTIHPVTTPAWISFMTGRNQGQHGVYDHVQRREDSYALEVMDASKIKTPLFFDYLGQQGLRSISINVPQTYPPPAIPGLMVSGLFGTLVGPGITNPPDLYERIAQVASTYVVHPDFYPRDNDPLEKYRQDLLQSISDRTTVAEALLDEEDWQFAIIVYTATDQVQHAFWNLMEDDSLQAAPYRSAIYDVYKRIDNDLPRLLKFANEDTLVLIMSDHGAGQLHAIVNLNRWLSDEGFLKFKTNKSSHRRANLIGFLASAYKSYIPVRIRAGIRRYLQKQFTQAKEKMETELFATAIDWENTQAYSLGACGNIFINRKGREPQGSISSDEEYESLRQQIIERLPLLTTPAGTPLVKEVIRREEIYHGPYMEDAPDLVVIWHDYGYWGRARYGQNDLTLFQAPSTWDYSTLPLTGSHRPQGILIAVGPGIAKGQVVEKANLIDLTPTILSFLDVPVPTGFDGRTLNEMFTPPLKIEYQDADNQSGLNLNDHQFAKDEEELVMQHLKNLGYL